MCTLQMNAGTSGNVKFQDLPFGYYLFKITVRELNHVKNRIVIRRLIDVIGRYMHCYYN